METAAARGQTLLLRIAPYGTGADNDVPDWYRALVGPEKGLAIKKWRTDPMDPRYVEHFGGMVRDLGSRYDGHPTLESVDLSIVGAWVKGRDRPTSLKRPARRWWTAISRRFRRRPW